MENKYYTPEIEEFHVGFECEIKGKFDNDWQKVTLGKDAIWHQFTNLENLGKALEQIRVKHLDREDITECGFKLSEDVCPYNGKIIFKTIEKSDGFLDGYITHYELYFTNSKLIFIYKISRGGFIGAENIKDKIFDGYIKNKSELKKIMKMLNIHSIKPNNTTDSNYILPEFNRLELSTAKGKMYLDLDEYKKSMDFDNNKK